LPIGKEENFSGLIDLVQNVAYSFEENPNDQLGHESFTTVEIPADMVSQAKEYRDKLIEAVSDFDDVIAEKYLNGEEISVPELLLGVRKATISLQFTGVIPGSAFKKKGVQRLLDCVVNFPP
jgi:elongation factor G